jgi:hypothetical protein
MRVEVRFTMLCVSLIAFGLIFAGISAAAIDAKTIVGLWLFDEGAGNDAKDTSGKGNHGELMKSPKWVAGKFGTALEFDGKTGYVQIPSSPALDPGEGDMTITAWVKTTATGDLYIYHNPEVQKFEWRLQNNKIRLYVRDSTSNTWRDSDSTLNDGKWHFIATVWKGSLAKATIDHYLDGDLNNQAAYGNQGIGKGTNIVPVHPTDCIGARCDKAAPERHFNGVVDEVAIFNTALDEADIQSLIKGFKTVLAVSPKGKLTVVWGEIKTR